MAVEKLWPEMPLQVCQFHVLRDASKAAFEADKQVKTAMRKCLQPKVRALRKQLKRDIPQASAVEANQLAVLDEYATAMASRHWISRQCTPPKVSMKWKPAGSIFRN